MSASDAAQLNGAPVAPDAPTTCPNHPDNALADVCTRCGQFLCGSCQAGVEPPMCGPCEVLVRDPLKIRSEPFSVGASLRHGWRLLAQRPLAIGGVCLLFSVPGGWITWALTAANVRELSVMRAEMVYDGLIGLVGTLACVALMSAAAEGRHLAFHRSLHSGLAAWPRVFGTNLRAGLMILGYTLLLVVPGVLKALEYMLTTPAAFREPWRNGLETSSRLTAGRRGALFGLACAAVLPMIVVIFSWTFVTTFAFEMAELVAPGSMLDSRLVLPLTIVEDFVARAGFVYFDAVLLAAFYSLKHSHGESLQPEVVSGS